MRIKETIGKMNEAEDNLSFDPEVLHRELDKIILDAMPAEIRDRYNEISENATFWAYA